MFGSAAWFASSSFASGSQFGGPKLKTRLSRPIPVCSRTLIDIGDQRLTSFRSCLARPRGCHFAGAPAPTLLKHLLKGEGGAAE